MSFELAPLARVWYATEGSAKGAMRIDYPSGNAGWHHWDFFSFFADCGSQSASFVRGGEPSTSGSEYNGCYALPESATAGAAHQYCHGFDNNPHLDAVRAIAEGENAIVVPICNKLEAEIAELDDEEKGEFLAELGMEEAGLDKVIRAGYDLLGLHTYFTAGVKEVRAWTIPLGATAPQAAGKIHTDFEKGFIRAEVIGYDDFIAYKGEQGAKDAGKWRLEGKDYIVKDGDVVHFRFNV